MPGLDATATLAECLPATSTVPVPGISRRGAQLGSSRRSNPRLGSASTRSHWAGTTTCTAPPSASRRREARLEWSTSRYRLGMRHLSEARQIPWLCTGRIRRRRWLVMRFTHHPHLGVVVHATLPSQALACVIQVVPKTPRQGRRALVAWPVVDTLARGWRHRRSSTGRMRALARRQRRRRRHI